MACSRLILKFLSDEAVAGILERTGAVDNDLIFFGADSAKVVSDALGALRSKIGAGPQAGRAGWRPLWVVDFPMFEFDADSKRWVAHASVHRAQESTILPRCWQIRARPWPRPTTSCSTARRSAAVRCIHRADMQSVVFGGMLGTR